MNLMEYVAAGPAGRIRHGEARDMDEVDPRRCARHPQEGRHHPRQRPRRLNVFKNVYF